MNGRARGYRTRALTTAALVGLTVVAASAAGTPVHAASPASGTIDGSAPVSWDFGPVGGPTSTTDTYNLTVVLPAPAATYYAPDARQGTTHAAVLTVVMTWTTSAADQAYGMSATDPSSNAVGNDTGSTINDGGNTNILTIQDPVAGKYAITASSAAPASTAATSPHAVATLRLVNLAGQPQPAQPSGGASFDNYVVPVATGSYGEPSVGVDPRPGHDVLMYQASLTTMKATFDDSTKPATPTWTDVTAPSTSALSLDAILAIDRGTGRTFVSQLLGACSNGAVSDTDGTPPTTGWTPAAPCEVPAGADHQTIGAGPYAVIPTNPVYPNAVYYCSQNVAEAECALSVNGGISYGNASPIYTSASCFGLHGHVKVSPTDGAVYVPNKACGAPECIIVTSTAGPNCHPGMAVSTDNGGTWNVRTINDGHSPLYGMDDPSIGIGSGGTVYYGYRDRDGHPKMSVCTNHGAACSASSDVSGPFHIENTRLATVVAGDDNRAAFSFIGTSTPGDDQAANFQGAWHLYVAVTYDGGATWTTTDATPDHPIQRGCVEFNSSCPSASPDNQRNLLDFNDTSIDAEGRVVVAYTDGCDATTSAGHGSCLTDATRLSGYDPAISAPALLRQSCGRTLFASFDAKATACAPATNVPELGRPAGLAVLGLGLAGLVAITRRRRRTASA